MQVVTDHMRKLLGGPRAWRWDIPLLLVLAGLAEGIGLATLAPLIVVATQNPAASTKFSETFVGGLNHLGLPADYQVLIGLMMAAILLKAGLLLLAMRHVGFVIARQATELRLSLIQAQLRSAWTYLTRQPAGKLAHAIGSESTRASMAYLHSAQLLADVIQTAIYFLLSLLISWRLSVLALLIGCSSIALLYWPVRHAKRAAKQQTGLTTTLTARVVDALAGIKPLKATAQDELIGTQLESNARHLEHATRRVLFSGQAVPVLQEPILAIFANIAMIGAATLLQEPLQNIILIGAILYRISGKVARVQKSYLAAATSEHVLAELRRNLDEAKAAMEPALGASAPMFARGIELREASFAYDGKVILDRTNLTIPAGGMTVIFGQSGAGKTTLIDLITGLHQPASGAVLIDGVPLAELDLNRWRHMVGYVSQDVTLFHDTVRNNVTLGDPRFGDDEVRAALALAEALHFVDELEHGLETVVAERGSALSGGQRQRIALARALIFAPKLLILDEATAALDAVTERAVIANLRSKLPALTILMVSHQPALAALADQVYCLAKTPERPREERAPIPFFGIEQSFRPIAIPAQLIP